MRTLQTKDGRNIGNAIVVTTLTHLALGTLYCIETDFGNKARMTFQEINDWFYWGDPMDYGEWKLRRKGLMYPDDGK